MQNGETVPAVLHRAEIERRLGGSRRNRSAVLAREGMRALRHVTEQVVFLGTTWKWVWMYEVGGRKLGYLHPMETGLSGTFILSESEERELAGSDGLPRATRQAIRDGRIASGVRWCWMEFPDLDAVDAFVHIIQLKHQLLARPE